MEPTVTISLSLPVSKAHLLLQYLQALDSANPEPDSDHSPPEQKSGDVTTRQKPEFEVVMLTTAGPTLRQLLDEQSRKLVSFALARNGSFYNRDLAVELQVDTPLTSIHLGHLTRKLQRVGVDANGWYTKHRTANGTLLTIRDDVMEKFAQAMNEN